MTVRPVLVSLDVPVEPLCIVRCRRCHRLLTDPESRALQLGPECQHWAVPARDWQVEQDALPGM